MSRIYVNKFVCVGTLAIVGCTQDVPGDEDVELRQPIIGGTVASQYPESALVDLYKNGSLNAYCSGAVIAPKVVLTAGHCVDGFSSWKIAVPFAGKQAATANSGATYDWTGNSSEKVNAKQHDIGLLFLESAITLPESPVVAQAPVANGAKVVDIGRIQNGKLSKTSLFVSSAISVTGAASQGYPYDYYSTDVIESGDSGGPVVASNSSPHQIVAVNSGAGSGEQVLARVDLLYSWIDQQVKAHGGWSSSNGTQGTGGSSGVGGNGSTGGSTGVAGSTSVAGSIGTGGSGTVGCAHDLCTSGARLASSCNQCVTRICAADAYCCANAWDSVCVSEAQNICGQSCGSTCAHSICATGSSLKASCDSCAAEICADDSYCCKKAWDAQCVYEVGAICAQAC